MHHRQKAKTQKYSSGLLSLASAMVATPAATRTQGWTTKATPAAATGLTRSMRAIHFGCFGCVAGVGEVGVPEAERSDRRRLPRRR